jgi:carbamoyl-phosphate synthase small subunit
MTSASEVEKDETDVMGIYTHAGGFEMKAMLALEDGTVFRGESFGAKGERVGEVVFNTSMTGYQEILTDSSYKGQIVVMTYPLIGNYGCNDLDLESDGPQVEGFVVREYTARPSNWRSQESLTDFLGRHGVVGIQGVDTRALTRKLRIYGVMRGVISTEDLDPDSLVEKARSAPPMEGSDLVRFVTCDEPYRWEGGGTVNPVQGCDEGRSDPPRFRVVAVDCGIKHNILRLLHDHGCSITVVPATTSSREILGYDPDGIFLSNGPGDPAALPYLVETVRELIGTGKPIFGICLGHQILGLAFGGKTFKLKFGHRGANQPVKDLATGRVEITSQNHGFCVDIDSIEDEDVEITHINLNDMTLEGMRHRRLPIFSVQYHPEASPGPHDARYLFRRFIDLMER